MKYRSYEIVAGRGWYDVIITSPKYSVARVKDIWIYGIKYNFYFYMNKWFGFSVPLSKKQKRLLKAYESLEE
jgi:hypothetical protein